MEAEVHILCSLNYVSRSIFIIPSILTIFVSVRNYIPTYYCYLWIVMCGAWL